MHHWSKKSTKVHLIKIDHEKVSLINESEIVYRLEKDPHIRYFKLPENNGWNQRGA